MEILKSNDLKAGTEILNRNDLNPGTEILERSQLHTDLCSILMAKTGIVYTLLFFFKLTKVYLVKKAANSLLFHSKHLTWQ